MHRRPTATTPRLFAFGLIASAAAVVSASTASAATITWDGGAGTLNWLTPTNWSGDVLPGPGDDVVIDAAGAVTIALAGSATINSLTCADGLTVSAAGSLTVATTAQVNGVVTLSDGKLVGGSWTVPGGVVGIGSAVNRLDGLTLNGNASVGTNARLYLRNGLTLNGTLSLTGTNPRLVCENTMTIGGNATLQFDAGAFNPARLNIEGASTVTFGPSTLVEGGWAEFGASLSTPGTSTIVNKGTMRCDTGAASFQITGEGFVNEGTAEATAGTLSVLGGVAWSNTGLIRALTTGTVSLAGSVDPSDLGSIQNISGTVQLVAPLDLAGGTLALGPATGVWTLAGTTLSSGTLSVAPGFTPILTGDNTVLDAMTVVGTLSIGTNQRLWIRNGLTLDGVISMVASNPRLIVDGTQTIDGNATLQLDANPFNPARINLEGTSILTFASSVLVEGGWALIGQQLQTPGNSGVVNLGTIRCDTTNATFQILDESFTNGGSIEVTAGTLVIGSTTWSNTGTMQSLGGTLRLEGSTTLDSLDGITNGGGAVQSALSLNLAGQTWTIPASTGTVTFDGGTISNGVLTIESGASAAFTGSNSIFDAMTVNGPLTIGTNQRLWVRNGFVLNGTLTMNGSNPRLIVDGTQTISGNGTVNLAAASFNPARINVEGTSTVTFAPTILMEGGWAEFGQQLQTAGVSTIVNQGTMRCTVANAIYTIIGEGFTNAGTVEATSGTVSINPTTSWNNTGLIRALTGGSIALEGPTNLASLGDIRNVSGTVLVRSSLALAGGTLALNATTGPWTFDGCTLSGGTLSTGTILPLFTGSNTIFNGMTVNGNLTIGTNQRLIVKGGLTLNGAITMNGTNPRLVFDGTQTFGGNATVVLNAAAFNPARINVDGASTVTFAPSVLFEGGWAEFGNSLFTNGVSTIVNNGVLRCNQANATFTIAGESATNNGLIETISGTLVVENATNLAAGTLTGGVWKSTNGTLRFGTALDGLPITTLAAECSISGRTGKILNLSKLESIATTGILRLADGAVLTAVPASGTLVDNGFLFVSGISKLNVTGGFTHAPTAVITVATGAAGQIVVDASGPLTLDGVLQVSNGPGYTPVAGDQVIVTDGSSRVGTFATLTTCEASDLFYTPTQAVYVYGEDTGVFGDLNGDGFVGPADLALLLGSWGQCSDLCCQADLDLSGDVGPADIALLLGSWG